MKQILLLLVMLSAQHPCFSNEAGGGDPIADFSYYIEFIGVGSEVYFLNESVDGDTYSWDFGDGGTSTELNPVHAYPEPGIFVVCLTATNDFGSDTWCDTINTYYAPSADFSFTGDPLVIFTDLSTNYPESWDWFFGDGETSDLQNPEHLFLVNGEYNVCLSVNNPGGTSYTCKPVLISSYLSTEAAFTFTGDPSVSFTDLSTNSPFEWFWDFGDGDTSTEQNPTHLYLDNGEFTVCLNATNAGGTDTFCDTVSIDSAIAAPVADFTYLIIDLGVAFVDESLNDPFEWYWDFGDGNSSTEQNPVHVYDVTGNYTVCLTATNEGGDNTYCEDLFVIDGIEESNEQLIQLYPNPVDGNLTVTLQENLTNGWFIITDITGKLIFEAAVMDAKIEFTTTGLDPGMYLISITNSTGETSFARFIVM